MKMLLERGLQPDVRVPTCDTSDQETTWTFFLKSMWVRNGDIRCMTPPKKKEIYAISTAIFSHFVKTGASLNIMLKIKYVAISAYRIFMMVPAALVLINLCHSCDKSSTSLFPNAKSTNTEVLFYLQESHEDSRPAVRLDPANAFHLPIFHAIAGTGPSPSIGSLPYMCAEVLRETHEPDPMNEHLQELILHPVNGWL